MAMQNILVSQKVNYSKKTLTQKLNTPIIFGSPRSNVKHVILSKYIFKIFSQRYTLSLGGTRRDESKNYQK